MITQIQKDLEDVFYDSLGGAGFGHDIRSRYPNENEAAGRLIEEAKKQ